MNESLVPEVEGSTNKSPRRKVDQEFLLKQELLKCASSLTKRYHNLRPKDPKRSILQNITNDAVMKGDFKFIQWLLEMAVGKPGATIKDVRRLNTIEAVSSSVNGNKLLEMAMEARKAKTIEDTSKKNRADDEEQ